VAAAGAGLDLEDHVSPHLVCPISHRIMELPVISPSGNTYECTPLLEWLRRRSVDPLNMKPVSACSLYPNRALHSEVLEQLRGVADKADASGDARLAEAARAKLEAVRNAQAPPILGEASRSQAGALERLAGLSARRAAWWWLLLREQVLVFATSFGALLCLAFDAAQLTKGLLGQSRVQDEARPQMLSTFFRLAGSPMLQLPKHWQRFDRLSLVVLRCALALPAGSLLATVALGGLASLGRFAQRCSEVRDVELERAAHSRLFVWGLNICSGITGLTSFALFVRVYSDWREGRQYR